MLNSMAAGRRLAMRAVLWQCVASLVLAALLLIAGPQHAAGALAGGGVVALGNALVAWLGLRRDAPAAAYALGRLVFGLVLKWVLIAAVLLIGIGMMQLPALALLAGLLVSVVAYGAAGATAKH